MLNWIAQHSSALQVFLNGLMVLIWILYLQVFLTSFRRQRRSDVLITLGAGVGLSARCFVTNLGLEPVYLLDLLIEIETEKGTHNARITDRTELTDEELNNPAEATNQGPLKSGEFIDIGNFETLIKRASSRRQTYHPEADVFSIEITALVATATTSSLAGASRKYMVRSREGKIHLFPTEIIATQVRSRAGRRRLRKKLSRRLDE